MVLPSEHQMTKAAIDVASRLAKAFSRLDVSCPSVREYVEARQSGFLPVQRFLNVSSEGSTSTIVLRRGSVEKRITSGTHQFHQCSLSHHFTSRTVLLPDEIGNSSANDEERTITPGDIAIELEVGTVRASSLEIRHFELIENTAPCERRFRLWMVEEPVRGLDLVSADPTCQVRILLGGQLVNRVKGYIDTVNPFMHAGEALVQIDGVDGLFGTRALVSGVFNSRVDPWWGLSVFAAGCDPGLLAEPQALDIPSLDGLDEFTGRSSLKGFHEFTEFLQQQAQKHAGKNIEVLCRGFETSLSLQPHQFNPLTASAFRNSAIVIHNQLPVQLAIGSVRGLRVEGIVHLAPNILIAGPDAVPFRLQGAKIDRPLCHGWDDDASRIITFFLASDAPQTPDGSEECLTAAFTLLSIASLDTAWCHKSLSGREARFAVDGKAQDAILELEPWYHVHHLFHGTAHQYYRRRDRSTNVLALTNQSIESLVPRIRILKTMEQRARQSKPVLRQHLTNAMRWLSRSRGSTTNSERFLCAWISLEFLVLRGTTKEDAIKAAVSSRVSTLMSRGDRTRRRYWQGLLDEAYDVRCNLVHEAREDQTALNRLLPIITQAAIQIIAFCSLSVDEIEGDISPTELLDQLRNSSRSGEMGGSA